MHEKEKRLKDSAESLKKQREEILSLVEPEIRTSYDVVVQKKQGIALARVNGETCGACQMKLRAQVLNEVMQGKTLISCENCCRFLYIES